MPGMGHIEPLAQVEAGPPVARLAERSVRRDLVCGLRHQLEAGAYDPPVEALVERLVRFVLACRAADGRP